MNQQHHDRRTADAVLNDLGGRLRALRRTGAMTLKDLSAQTGLSINLLSRLENGLRRPTVDVMLALARVYRVSLDELVGAPATGDPRTHPRPAVRHGMTVLPLTRTPGGIQAMKLIIPATPTQPPPDQRRHQGYEWMYVLGGRLRLYLGEHNLLLVTGEVAEFDTRTPHAFTNPGPTPTELLVLMGAQGERAHVRARPARTPA